jgi:hypothetical protein
MWRPPVSFKFMNVSKKPTTSIFRQQGWRRRRQQVPSNVGDFFTRIQEVTPHKTVPLLATAVRTTYLICYRLRILSVSKICVKLGSTSFARHEWNRGSFPGLFHQFGKNVGYKPPFKSDHVLRTYACISVYIHIYVVRLLLLLTSSWNHVITSRVYNLIFYV